MLILLGKISKYVYNSLYKGSNMNLDKCKPHWWHVYFKQYLILDSYFAVICTGIWLLRHKIIWNYFWSEFFLIYHYIKQMQSIYMNLHAIFNVAIWYGCLWYSLNIVYWIPVLEFSFWVWFLCCHIDFRPCFFLWFALYHFDERTVEYMYLFNS